MAGASVAKGECEGGVSSGAVVDLLPLSVTATPSLASFAANGGLDVVIGGAGTTSATGRDGGRGVGGRRKMVIVDTGVPLARAVGDVGLASAEALPVEAA